MPSNISYTAQTRNKDGSTHDRRCKDRVGGGQSSSERTTTCYYDPRPPVAKFIAAQKTRVKNPDVSVFKNCDFVMPFFKIDNSVQWCDDRSVCCCLKIAPSLIKGGITGLCQFMGVRSRGPTMESREVYSRILGTDRPLDRKTSANPTKSVCWRGRRVSDRCLNIISIYCFRCIYSCRGTCR